MNYKSIFLAIALLTLPAILHAAVIEKTVEYKQGDAVLEGYLAYDESLSSLRPGVIVVHDWKGLNDYAKSRTRQLAELGYVAFAADIYGKGRRAKDHEEAGKLAGAYKNDRNLMRARAKAALDFLKAQPNVDPEKIAAIGYCFGGTAVLEMARAGFDLKGVASFHGGLETPLPAHKGAIKAKIRVYHGAAEIFVTPAEVEAFKKEMTDAGADFQFHAFEGAVHAFTVPDAGNDPSTGAAYNEKADKESWAMLMDFFKEIFA